MSTLLGHQSFELVGGQAQAAGDRIRMSQKDAAGGGETEPAAATIDQADPELPLERENLLRHRGLSERQLLRCPGERTEPGYLAKGEKAAWIQY
jgi:hypothetical protein